MERSSWKDVVSGVPKGSAMGPVLFIIYIKDHPEAESRFFADDTKIYNKALIVTYLNRTLMLCMYGQSFATVFQC